MSLAFRAGGCFSSSPSLTSLGTHPSGTTRETVAVSMRSGLRLPWTPSPGRPWPGTVRGKHVGSKNLCEKGICFCTLVTLLFCGDNPSVSCAPQGRGPERAVHAM